MTQTQVQEAAQAQEIYPCWTEGMERSQIDAIKGVLCAYIMGADRFYYSCELDSEVTSDFLKYYLKPEVDLETNDEMMKAITALSRVGDQRIFRRDQGVGSQTVGGQSVIQELVDLGLPLGIKNRKGDTFYHLLADVAYLKYKGNMPKGMLDFMHFLLEKGIDPTETNKDGHKASQYPYAYFDVCRMSILPLRTAEIAWRAAFNKASNPSGADVPLNHTHSADVTEAAFQIS